MPGTSLWTYFHITTTAMPGTSLWTFMGCCLHFVLEKGLQNLCEKDLEDMLRFANAAASIITTRRGALKVMPDIEEVNALLEK